MINELNKVEIQEKINHKYYDRNFFMTIIGNILYACWIFLDFLFIDADFWPVPYFMRPLLAIIMIPICFLPRKILIKYMHLFITINYTLGFLLIIPFFFHTDYYLVYFTGACLIPLFLVGGLGVSLKDFSIFSFFSILGMLVYHQSFLRLTSDLLVFTILYMVTIFGLSFVACIFLNRVSKENIILESKQKYLITEKTSLLLLLSHDMANMVNIAQMSAKNLYKEYSKSSNDDDKIAKTWMRLLNSLKSQFEVLSTVRETQALNSGKIIINVNEVDIVDIFDNLNLMYKEICDRKKIKLNFFIKGEKFKIESDGTILKNNILSNLLNNAIKFSYPQSEINITANYEKDRLYIRVEDSGTGMSQEFMEDLFEIDKKTSKTGTNGEKGTGFGMPLVKASVDKLGGEIKIESIQMNSGELEEHGTTVIIILDKSL